MIEKLMQLILEQQEQLNKLNNTVENLSSQLNAISNVKKEENELTDDSFEEMKKLRELNEKMPEWATERTCYKCKSSSRVKFSNLTEYDYSCNCDESDVRLKSMEVRLKNIEKMLNNPDKVIVGNSIKLENLIVERLNNLEKIKKEETDITSYSDIMKVVNKYKEKHNLTIQEEGELINLLKETYKVNNFLVKEI